MVGGVVGVRRLVGGAFLGWRGGWGSRLVERVGREMVMRRSVGGGAV